MILHVKPSKRLRGTVALPSSKSYSIRAYIVAACGGSSKITNPSDCDDALVAKIVAKALGCRVTKSGANAFLVKPVRRSSVSKFNVKESGTVLRLLIPLLAAREGNFLIKGEGTLRGRPNHHLVKLLKSLGVDVKGKGPKHGVPLRLKGGNFTGGNLMIDGSLSSQFISALLIAAPLLKKPSRIRITGAKVVSSDYITMTLQILKASGITIQKKSLRDYQVRPAQKFKGLKNFNVPSDYGLAAFLLAAAALTDSSVTLKGNLKRNFVQADGAILPLLKKMGVRFQKSDRAIMLKGPSRIKGGTFSLKNCPDLVPIMAVLALFAEGTTRLKDIEHARVKESDRISDLRKELLKIGADVRETAGTLVIRPQPTYKSGVLLDPKKDHRLAMAFSVLGIKVPVRVKDIECMSKSYPGFVRDLRKLGVKLKKIK